MEQKERIKALIEKSRVGMFSTQDQDKIFSRPIAYADVDDDNIVWFFSDVHSEKIADIINNRHVNFSFSSESDNAYVSLSGKAELVNDQKIIEEKWSFFMKAWYPKGSDSERLTLIKVTPETVQYWDDSSSKIVQLYKMAKAIITGKSYVDVADSDNEVVEYK